MMNDEIIRREMPAVISELLEDYRHGRAIDRMEPFTQPDRDVIVQLIDKLRRLVLPGYFRDRSYKTYDIDHSLTSLVEDVAYYLKQQIVLALRDTPDADTRAQEITVAFLHKLPEIRALVETDLQAGYDGDPAAYSIDEVIIAYPGLYAIIVNRLAHALWELKVPLIPRIMTEHAHSLTGIDIHPGATIGRYFFIDHGTGIVVGETTVIGNNVKLYQGVTLGALSTRGGQSLRGKRRHPTIEDDVTIYAGASILGGESVIGRGSVIGSNVFITHSIAPGTRVSVANQELLFKERSKEKTPEMQSLISSGL